MPGGHRLPGESFLGTWIAASKGMDATFDARTIGLAGAGVGLAMGMRLITTRLSLGRGGGRRHACVND